MRKLFQRLLLGLVLGVGVYAAGAIYVGVRELGRSLASFSSWLLVPVLGLTLANYLVRYLKWSYYLRQLSIEVETGRNLTIFCGGLSMVVTPGKIGELLKAYLLRASQSIPMARTAPVVMAERITDLIALVLLMLGGAISFRAGWMVMSIVGGAVVAFLIVISSRTLSRLVLRSVIALPGMGRLGDKLEAFYESIAALFRPRPLAVASALSVASWSCECLGSYLIVGGFPDTRVSLQLATFIYCATTLGGLPTPGGLGLTDGGMAALLSYLGRVERGVAAAATLLIRLCTLWFAVLVGVIALLLFRRRVGFGDDVVAQLQRVRDDEKSAAPER